VKASAALRYQRLAVNLASRLGIFELANAPSIRVSVIA
jgi:hypothetical protein